MQSQKNKLIGLTGGIASGKSTVAKLFSLLQVPVYHSDERAKHLILTNKDVKNKLIAAFGEESYLEDGSYHVKHISSIVFADEKKLKQLNDIVHPAVFKDQEDWFNKQIASYSLIESALLFEANKQKQFDFIIVVAADDIVRANRIVKRNQLSLEQANKRIASQMEQSKKIEQADFVIWNNGNKSVIEQVMTIHQQLING